MTELQTISAQQVQVLVAIRKELGLEADLSGFTRQLEEQNECLGKQIDAFLHEVSTKVFPETAQ